MDHMFLKTSCHNSRADVMTQASPLRFMTVLTLIATKRRPIHLRMPTDDRQHYYGATLEPRRPTSESTSPISSI